MLSELNSSEEFYFQWHITERCNKHCRHCYQNEHPSDDLPLHDLEVILKRMEEALIKWDLKGSLSLTGGEPFIRKPELFQLMKRIDEIPVFEFYDILSNGSLITEDVISQLKDCRKLRRIQVSLEGSTPQINNAIRGEGSYQETLNAIRILKKHDFTVSVMTTISRSNSQDILSIIKLLVSEGVDNFSMERLIPEGRGKMLGDQLLSPEELRHLYTNIYAVAVKGNKPRILMYRPLFHLIAPADETVGARCSMGSNALTIMPDGTVYPCRRLPIPIGNVLSDGLFSIWYNSDLLWQVRNPDNIRGKCHDCEYLAGCRGCRAMAFFCTGDYLAEDPQCWH